MDSSSRQAIKEENADAAVDNLSEKRHEEEEEFQQKAAGSGIIGSIMKSMGDRYEQVKEAVTANKPHDDHVTRNEQDEEAQGENVTMVEIGQYTNYERAKEPNESVMDKAREYKDYTSEKKDIALEKAGEYEDYGMDKVKEDSEAVSGKMGELKESARRTMDYITGKADQKALEGGDINEEKYGETESKAREKMQELKLNEEGVYDEAKQRAWADKETAADRGVAAKRNIYGAMGTVKDAIREKLTYPTDIVKEAREYGGPKRGRGDKLVEGGPAAMPASG